jgi:hypothetical protein
MHTFDACIHACGGQDVRVSLSIYTVDRVWHALTYQHELVLLFPLHENPTAKQYRCPEYAEQARTRR